MSGDAPSALTALVRGQRMFGFRDLPRSNRNMPPPRRVEVGAPLFVRRTADLKSLTRVAQAQRGAGEAFPYCRAPSHCRAHQHWRGRAAEI
jgi:hypothetical protein